MCELELTRAEKALLRRAEKTTHWWGSWKWEIVSAILAPLVFIAVNFHLTHQLVGGTEYVLCIRYEGKLAPLDISVVHTWESLVVFIGVIFMATSVPNIVHLRERRLFYDLVQKFKAHSQEG